MALVAEVECGLRGTGLGAVLHQMYGDEPAAWDDSLRAPARLRVIINALTRLRFCTPDGKMEFETKEGTGAAPVGYLPWFDVPGRQTARVTVAFGHWSALGALKRPGLLALDTGCVWGGHLSAVRLNDATGQWPHSLIQVKCQATLSPGKQV